MDFAYRHYQYFAFAGHYRYGNDGAYINVFLRVRFNMCSYLVPVQAYNA